MSQPTDLPLVLVDYFAQREQERLNAVRELLGALTERERLLVKEAAVMGWVQGKRHHDLDVPKDRQILITVVDACRSHSDLYPNLTNHQPDSED